MKKKPIFFGFFFEVYSNFDLSGSWEVSLGFDFFARGLSLKRKPPPAPPRNFLQFWVRLNRMCKLLHPPRSELARVTSKISRSE